MKKLFERMTEIRVKMLGVFNKSGDSDVILKFSGGLDMERLLKKLADEGIFNLHQDTVNLEETIQNTLVLLNGVEVRNLEGIKTRVEDGDTLILIPVTHGG